MSSYFQGWNGMTYVMIRFFFFVVRVVASTRVAMHLEHFGHQMQHCPPVKYSEFTVGDMKGT
jgi:hypothetical protein